MRDELKKYGDEAYKMVEYAAREIGPRLPGSNNEKKYHDYMWTSSKSWDSIPSPRASCSRLTRLSADCRMQVGQA